MAQKVELKPFQKVLVRDNYVESWKIGILSHVYEAPDSSPCGDDYPFACVGNDYRYCIPYEGNEDLLGTDKNPKSDYIPEDGDILVRYEQEVLICKRPVKKEEGYYFRAYAAFRFDDEELRLEEDAGPYSVQVDLRPATVNERYRLLIALDKEGLGWDEEEKEIVDLRWQPDPGGIYYYISEWGDVYGCTWDGRKMDIERRESFNCFKEKEAAESASKKEKEMRRRFAKELKAKEKEIINELDKNESC